ncbi:MAG TPA: hypothetical protein VF384_04945 [Planctomycetota bacterium]
MRALLLLPLLCAGLAAQAAEPQPPAPPAQKPAVTPAVAPAPVTRAHQRAIDDVQAACRKFLQQAHAFTGTCKFPAGVGEAGEGTTVVFQGAWQDGLALHTVPPHSVVTYGERELVRVLERPWTLPQGDAPDCPLSPRMLATHLPSATIQSWSAASHDDRPAMRVHAVWTGKQARALAAEAAVPHSKSQQALESIGLLTRVPNRVVVDATVCFDPATKSLLAATLRIAVLGDEEWPADTEPTPSPAGLPPLPKPGLAEFTFDVLVVAAEKVPMPVLDGKPRELLGLPPR